MSEPPLRHHVICLDSRINILLVNSNSNPHQHVLRPFNDLPLYLQEVRPLKGLEAKVIIVKVPVVNYLAIQSSSILVMKNNKSQNLIITNAKLANINAKIIKINKEGKLNYIHDNFVDIIRY